MLLRASALLSILAVLVALVSQHIFGMQPCAWCVLQRLIFLVIALVCALGGWSASRPVRKVAAGLSVVLAGGGVAAAWYQHSVASHLFSCDLTFADRFMVGTGLDAGLPWLFGIFATCMDARVAVLGVEYALWSLALFVVLGVLGLIALLRR